MRTLCIVVLFLSLMACRQKTRVTGEKQNSDRSMAGAKTAQDCYSYIKGKDTAMLTLLTTGKVSTGELEYKWFEKDKNIGTIEGEMHGDTLLASYTFNSEGQQSVRQVAFLKKGDQLLEGTGDVADMNGKVQFKDLSKLSFGKSVVFQKVACK
ncbi:hypothetical protein [Nubsella zeaxanthinifaciens]|uniref:hypothetical protein n=1 Tax=Nubsella zeaxanthinifaciens TaxID=392412 RepID=UPI001300BCD9|nr:hypothetical protein [Nubsella zeaxanthinifaciens]